MKRYLSNTLKTPMAGRAWHVAELVAELGKVLKSGYRDLLIAPERQARVRESATEIYVEIVPVLDHLERRFDQSKSLFMAQRLDRLLIGYQECALLPIPEFEKQIPVDAAQPGNAAIALSLFVEAQLCGQCLRGWAVEIEQDARARSSFVEAKKRALAESVEMEAKKRSPEDARKITPQPAFCFRLSGKIWEIRFEDEHGMFPTKKGFGIIAHLLKYPDPPVPIPALLLQGLDLEVVPQGMSFQPILDTKALRECRRRLKVLHSDREAAQRDNDALRLAECDTELETLKQQIDSAISVRGNQKGFDDQSAQKSARASAAAALNRAYKELLAVDPPLPKLRDHLKSTIKAEGNAYAYRPASTLLWVLA